MHDDVQKKKERLRLKKKQGHEEKEQGNERLEETEEQKNCLESGSERVSKTSNFKWSNIITNV